MKENVIKAAVSAAWAVCAAYFGVLTVPLIMLGVVAVLDWCTGLTKAWVKGTLSSKVGAIGAVKKLTYAVTIAVGMVVDYIIAGVLTQLGIEMTGTCYVGMLVTVWLIVNELISILENVHQIGVPIPAFLGKIVSKLKVATEEKGEKEE